MENKKVMVLGVKRYSFNNRDTGELISGTKVHYYDLEPDLDENQVGFVASSENLPYEDFLSYKHMKLPAVCEAELSISLSGRKPVVKIKSFKQLQDTK
jgi:hypothetical protein